MPAVLFGSIGTLADTSELQRESFNEAFRAHGLDWEWSREEYRELLRGSGGAKRIAEHAQERGEQVDAAAVHRSKSELFQKKLRASHPQPRAGLADTIEQARSHGYKLALVTTTSPDNVTALADALRPQVDIDTFDLIVDTSSVEQSKPDPAAYRYALERLGEDAGEVVAIEDNVGGVAAAVSAGVTCIAFPGEHNAGHDFGAAADRINELTFDELQTHLRAA